MRHEEKSFSVSEIEQLLSGSKNYRRLDDDRWRTMLRDMAGGRWRVTGVPIVFDRSGKLMDGQHRLRAAMEYQKSDDRLRVNFLVVSGIDREAESVIDTGAKRTIGHYLQNRGVKYGSCVGALLQIEAKTQMSTSGTLSGSSFQSGTKPSLATLVELFENDAQKIQDWCQRAYPAGSAVGSPGLICAVTWFIQKVNHAGCEEFLDLLESGAGLSQHDPILALRNAMLGFRSKARHAMVRRSVVAALIIKAWNAWANETEIRSLRWRQFGANPEAFPVIDAGPVWEQC